MGLLKKRKQYIWCSYVERPFRINGLSHVYNYNKYGNKFKELRGKSYLKIFGTNKNFTVPSLVKCPDCGKRFKPRVRQCHDDGCWHFYIPPHKKIIKVQ